ncbi:MAG: DUF1580 domain-containing protein [Pirellulales bacterium]
MIDLKCEQVFTLTQAAKSDLLPQRRFGKRPNIATFFRWAKRGLRGIVLETIQIGGAKCTSAEALQRFFERLSDPEPRPQVPTATPRQRQRAIDRAVAELRAA